MRIFNVSLVVGAIAMATLFVGDVAPVSADPTGTTFSFVSENFQGSGGDPAVPFGVPTSIPGSGVTVDSMVSVSPTVPGLTTGGLEFLDFWITTDDGGFLNGDSVLDSGWLISGLDWGPGSDPAFAEFLIFLSFDIDGVFVPLDGTLIGSPIVPHPITGQDTIPIDIGGTPADSIPFDTASLTGVPMLTTLLALGLSFGDALSVNSMHVGLEIVHIPAVPEPASLALMGLGLCSTLLMRRRKR